MGSPIFGNSHKSIRVTKKSRGPFKGVLEFDKVSKKVPKRDLGFRVLGCGACFEVSGFGAGPTQVYCKFCDGQSGSRYACVEPTRMRAAHMTQNTTQMVP